MADSRELQILKEVEELLDAATSPDGGFKPSGLVVHRFRTRPIQKDDLSGAGAIVIYALRDSVDAGSTDENAHDLEIGVELRAKGDASTPPDDALDPLYVWAVKALTEDHTLGGLVGWIEERGSEWDGIERDAIYGARRIVFGIDHLTTRTDPTAAT